MGQEEVFNFLKQNAGKFYSAEEIMIATKEKNNLYYIFNKLERLDEVEVKFTKGKTDKDVKIYRVIGTIDGMDAVMDEYNLLSQRKIFAYSPEALRQFMIIAELKKISKLLEAKNAK